MWRWRGGLLWTLGLLKHETLLYWLHQLNWALACNDACNYSNVAPLIDIFVRVSCDFSYKEHQGRKPTGPLIPSKCDTTNEFI